MAAIKATAKRAALIFIVSSPSQIGADHKKWVSRDRTLIDADPKLKLALCKKKTIAGADRARGCQRARCTRSSPQGQPPIAPRATEIGAVARLATRAVNGADAPTQPQ
jgi:hypothetical protein